MADWTEITEFITRLLLKIFAYIEKPINAEFNKKYLKNRIFCHLSTNFLLSLEAVCLIYKA